LPLFRRSRPPAGPASLPVDGAHGDPAAAVLRAALRDQSWPAAEKVLAGASDADHLALLLDAGATVAGTEAWLADVVRVRPDDTLASLLCGTRLIAWAWEARTGLQAQYVGQDQFELFFERLCAAEDRLQDVVRRRPDSAAAWHQLVITARGLQLGVPEARLRFERAVTLHPGHVWAHQQMLQMVCAKWFGSREMMYEFADKAMRTAPPGSPLGHLVAIAYLEESLDAPEYPAGMARFMRSPHVRAALREAADRSVRHPAYRPGPVWRSVHSAFAMAFALAGEYRAAAEQFRVLGDVVVTFPWLYLDGDQPGRAFCQLRAEAYAHG
jgi:hypothetical protein